MVDIKTFLIRFRFLLIMGILLAFPALACGFPVPEESTATPGATETVALVASSTAIAIATHTDVPIAQPTETIPVFPTSTSLPPSTIAATETPENSEPTPTNIPDPTTAPLSEALAPGQRASGQLVSGDFKSYAYIGKQFQPVMIFVEAGEELNVVVAAYEGDILPNSNLEDLIPLTQAAFSPSGRPELHPESPERNQFPPTLPGEGRRCSYPGGRPDRSCSGCRQGLPSA